MRKSAKILAMVVIKVCNDSEIGWLVYEIMAIFSDSVKTIINYFFVSKSITEVLKSSIWGSYVFIDSYSSNKTSTIPTPIAPELLVTTPIRLLPSDLNLILENVLNVGIYFEK